MGRVLVADINLFEGEKLEDLELNNLKIIQSNFYYRFSSDSVLLSNFVSKNEKGTIVDLGCGSGIIAILLSQKTAAKKIIGIEIQNELFSMAQRSVDYNNLNDKIEILNADLRSAHKLLGNEIADAVVFNPPYEKSNQSLSPNECEANCNAELNARLKEFVFCASKLLKFGGSCYAVIKAKRLADLIFSLKENNIEPKEMVLVVRGGKEADIALIKAKKGGKSGLKITVDTITD